MGHAAYARGNAAISAHISQQAKANRRADAWLLLQAERDREKARADKSEVKVAELEATLKAARRSVVSLRGSLECEREERKAQVDELKYKLKFAADALRRRMSNGRDERQPPGE